MVKTPNLKDKYRSRIFTNYMNILGKYTDKKNKRKKHCILAWDFHFFLNQTFKVAVHVKTILY